MKNIRNIAVIAHVDHGKTTLIDALLKQSNTFRDNQEEMGIDRILDSNDQERERGITITAKNCAIHYNDTKINIIDTPGHADFSGEVERTLGMADGALLIVDAQEGPMPQTTFVLKKALELGLKIIVVINKIDRPYAQIPQVIDKTESLFLDLVDSEDQLDFPILYAVAKDGKVFDEIPSDYTEEADVSPLLEKIVSTIPAPKDLDTEKFSMLVSSFEYDTHLGKIMIGRIHSGIAKKGDKIKIVGGEGSKSYSIEKLYVSEGLQRTEIEKAVSGDIISIAGISDAKIGDTVADVKVTEKLPTAKINEPTIHITVGPNTSPFAGREGTYSTSRQLEERLAKEVETNLSLKIKKLDNGKFEVSGRGELHLSVFLEDLRRDGYECEVEKPQVVIKMDEGVKTEPIEELTIVVPDEYVGAINQELGKRYADLIDTASINDRETKFVYEIPTRALIGLRGILIMKTKGTVIFSSYLVDYKPIGKEIKRDRSGVLISSESGETLAYGLKSVQERGTTFVGPGVKVYEGMIVGKNSKDDDLTVNVCRMKKGSAVRSHSFIEGVQLIPPVDVTLEMGLNFIESDELMEVTPQSIRLRKKVLNEIDRRKAKRVKK